MAEITLKDTDGCILHAPDAMAAVIKMRDESRFLRHQSVEQFMDGFRERCFLWNGKIIRTNTCQNFLDDLVKIGFFVEWLPPTPVVNIVSAPID
jgi:hypothetical protein